MNWSRLHISEMVPVLRKTSNNQANPWIINHFPIEYLSLLRPWSDPLEVCTYLMQITCMLNALKNKESDHFTYREYSHKWCRNFQFFGCCSNNQRFLQWQSKYQHHFYRICCITRCISVVALFHYLNIHIYVVGILDNLSQQLRSLDNG